jgi:hypothetical protein
LIVSAAAALGYIIGHPSFDLGSLEHRLITAPLVLAFGFGATMALTWRFPRTWLVFYASSLTLGGGLLAPIGLFIALALTTTSFIIIWPVVGLFNAIGKTECPTGYRKAYLENRSISSSRPMGSL